MFQSKRFLVVANAHWYTDNREIHTDFGVPFFPHYISSLNQASINTLRMRSFKLFKRPFPGFLTILTL